MKHFLALIIGILFCIGNTHPTDTPRDAHHIPTIIDTIHALMDTDIISENFIDPTQLAGFNQATINQPDENGWTLLSCALYKGFYGLARQLENYGAAIHWAVMHALDQDNNIALEPVLNYIKQQHWSVDFTLSSGGYTPLSYALTSHRQKCLTTLTAYGASLKNAYLTCIMRRNRALFNKLRATSPRQEAIALFGSLVLQSIRDRNFSAGSSLFNNIRVTAGDEITYAILQAIKNQYPKLIEPIQQNYTTVFQMVSIARAIYLDSVPKLAEALSMQPVIQSNILAYALKFRAQNIANYLTENGIFIDLQVVASVIHPTNQELAVNYLNTYMARYSKDESLDNLKALHRAAEQKQLHDLAYTCTTWLTQKIAFMTIEHDNLELLKTTLAYLERELIPIHLDTILSQALSESASKIVTWLCQERLERLDLSYAISLIHAENTQCAQIYLNHHLRLCPMQEYGIALFILEQKLAQKVEQLNNPSLTDWYNQNILPLLSKQPESKSEC